MMSASLADHMCKLNMELVKLNPLHTLIVVCDPDQLQPVQGKPFTSCQYWSDFCVIKLGQNHRQAASDPLNTLIADMASCRDVSPSREWLSGLIHIPGLTEDSVPPEEVMVAAAVRRIADDHNTACIEKLPGAPHTYLATDVVSDPAEQGLLDLTGFQEEVILRYMGIRLPFTMFFK